MTPFSSLSEFMARLDADERRRFDAAAHPMRATKGQTIIGQGPGSTDVYFIDDGAFEVLIYSKSGKQVSIRTLRSVQVDSRGLTEGGALACRPLGRADAGSYAAGFRT